MLFRHIFAAIAMCAVCVRADPVLDVYDAYIAMFNNDLARASAAIAKVRSASPSLINSMKELQNAYDKILGFDRQQFMPKVGVDSAYAYFATANRLLVDGNMELARKNFVVGSSKLSLAGGDQSTLDKLSDIKCHYIPTTVAKPIQADDTANPDVFLQKRGYYDGYVKVVSKIAANYTSLGDDLVAASSATERADNRRFWAWIKHVGNLLGIQNFDDTQFKDAVQKAITENCSFKTGGFYVTVFSPLDPMGINAAISSLPNNFFNKEIKDKLAAFYDAFIQFAESSPSGQVVDSCGADSTFSYPTVNATCMFTRMP